MPVAIPNREAAERCEASDCDPCPFDEPANAGQDAEHAGEQHARRRVVRCYLGSLGADLVNGRALGLGRGHASSLPTRTQSCFYFTMIYLYQIL